MLQQHTRTLARGPWSWRGAIYLSEIDVCTVPRSEVLVASIVYLDIVSFKPAWYAAIAHVVFIELRQSRSEAQKQWQTIDPETSLRERTQDNGGAEEGGE